MQQRSLPDTNRPEAELTRNVLAAAFEVSNQLGAGFLERVYQNAFLVELKIRGIPTQTEVALRVSYKGYDVGRYVADMIVDDRLVIEIKAIENLSRSHVGQTLNYLRATGNKLALLINFGRNRLQYQRVIL
tara:strand:+ start:242 stop:634 length:393 start_codon:yes stop_codon:yes gene_type:complete